MQCGPGLVCIKRDGNDPILGCEGTDTSNSDYCARAEFRGQQPAPSPVSQPTPTGSGGGGGGDSGFPDPKGHRLRLYWESGYYWQETHKETFWCMECNNPPCDAGNKLYITHCDSKNQIFDFDNVGGNEYLIKLVSPNKGLCMQREGNDIRMRHCNSNNNSQRWIAQRGSFSSYRFEITPKELPSKCITQRHHPKDGEEVELEPCTLARDSDTSFWETY